MKWLTAVTRTSALLTYVTCYGLVGGVVVLFSAGALAESLGFKTQGESVDGVLGILLISVGFALGSLLAIRARTNWLAHYSAMVVSTTQAVAAVAWGWRCFVQMELPETSGPESFGLAIVGTLLYAVAILAGVGVLGAACGRLADSLSGIESAATAKSQSLLDSVSEALSAQVQHPC